MLVRTNAIRSPSGDHEAPPTCSSVRGQAGSETVCQETSGVNVPVATSRSATCDSPRSSPADCALSSTIVAPSGDQLMLRGVQYGGGHSGTRGEIALSSSVSNQRLSSPQESGPSGWSPPGVALNASDSPSGEKLNVKLSNAAYQSHVDGGDRSASRCSASPLPSGLIVLIVWSPWEPRPWNAIRPFVPGCAPRAEPAASHNIATSAVHTARTARARSTLATGTDLVAV